MKLSEAVSIITGVALEEIVLLRHKNSRIKQIQEYKGSIDDYSLVQPKFDEKYNFRNFKALCVVIFDKVDSIFLIDGVEKEGISWDLVASGNVQMDKENNRPPRQSIKYKAYKLSNIPIYGLKVNGWAEAAISPVAKKGHVLFDKLTIDVPDGVILKKSIAIIHKSELEQDEYAEMLESIKSEEKRNDVARVIGITTHFVRNQAIVEKRIFLAGGICELCGNNTDVEDVKLPYSLEVHHIIPLSGGGPDELSNTVALCPNCHRRIHQQNRPEDVKKLIDKRQM